MTFRDYLLDAQPEDGKPVLILSAEGIKLSFDVVRNYGLAILVRLGAVEYRKLAAAVFLNQPPQLVEVLAAAVGWLLYGVAGALLLLNALFATYVFELTPFYRRRSSKFRWALGSVVVCSLLSMLVCGAILLARTHAA